MVTFNVQRDASVGRQNETVREREREEWKEGRNHRQAGGGRRASTQRKAEKVS